MMRHPFVTLAVTASLIAAGCGPTRLTPNQKAEANREWNGARAGVLASLAADQLQDGSLDKCQETLGQAFRLEPNNPKLHLLQAKLAIEQGKLEMADAHLATAGKLDPKNAEVDYLDGIVLQRWQQPEKARAAYAEAARKDPAELSYILAEAEMLVAMNKPVDALTLLQSGTNFFEHSSTIRDEIGQLLIQQNHCDQGIAMLREASLLATDDLTIREHLAFALLTDKQFAESAARFEELSLEPGYQKRADIQAALGECLGQTNSLTDAEKHYQCATELDSSCTGYWLGLAKIQVQLADYAQGEIAIRRVIAVDPNCSSAHSLLGYAKLKQGQLRESLKEFREASKLSPTDKTSLCMQGYVLQKMGNKAEAAILYTKVLELEPDNTLARRLSSGSASDSRLNRQ